MNCNFNNFKTNKYYGERNFIWFMKEVILKRLEQKGVQNPDEYVRIDMSHDEMRRRKRRRGIHSSPLPALLGHLMDEEEREDEGNGNLEEMDLNNSRDDDVVIPDLPQPPPSPSPPPPPSRPVLPPFPRRRRPSEMVNETPLHLCLREVREQFP